MIAIGKLKQDVGAAKARLEGEACAIAQNEWRLFVGVNAQMHAKYCETGCVCLTPGELVDSVLAAFPPALRPAITQTIESVPTQTADRSGRAWVVADVRIRVSYYSAVNRKILQRDGECLSEGEMIDALVDGFRQCPDDFTVAVQELERIREDGL